MPEESHQTPPGSRFEGANADPKSDIKRSKDIWFDDGNIVLQVDQTQFRVHGSILSRHSSVFCDMFALPQPNDKSHWVEGCPVVIMSDDSAEQWEFVFATFVYRVYPMSTTWLDIPRVAAMIHLGKKYDFSRLYKEVTDLFIVKFPHTLVNYDNSTENFEIWVIQNIEGIIGIAEEAGLWSVLPVVYYMTLTSRLFENDEGIFSPTYNIPAHHLRCLINGRIRITRAIVQYNFNWASRLWESDGSPPQVCRKAASCDKVRNKIVKKAFEQLGYDIQHALVRWKYSVEDRHALCDQCRRYGKRQFESGREKIWDQLGYLFFGNNEWDTLVDMNTDVLPTGWGQMSS